MWEINVILRLLKDVDFVVVAVAIVVVVFAFVFVVLLSLTCCFVGSSGRQGLELAWRHWCLDNSETQLRIES